MILLIRFFLSFLTAYFLGRTLYCSFCNSKEKQSFISRIHSFYLGLGATSIFFWYYTALTNGYNRHYPIVELIIILILYLFQANKHLKNFENKITINTSNNKSSSEKYLRITGIFMITLIAILCFFHCLSRPDGKWDALAMWNIKAKYLYCGNDSWSEIFSDNFEYAHRDYPLFLPCIIARSCIFIEHFTPLVPATFSFLFTIAFFILLFLYLIKLKNIYYSLFAICLLSFSSNIFNQGSKQYADIPLAVFILISLYELIIWDKSHKQNYPTLCVLFSCLCLWIKNEGIPWFLLYSFIVILFLCTKKISNKDILKKTFTSLLFSLPIILAVCSVKYLANFENDLVYRILERLKQIYELQRYKIILSFIISFVIEHFWIIIIPISLLLKFIDKEYIKYKCLLLIIVFMYIGYTNIYIITPHDLVWHLINSFPRIATHYLPSLLFLGCLLFDYKRNN